MFNQRPILSWASKMLMAFSVGCATAAVPRNDIVSLPNLTGVNDSDLWVCGDDFGHVKFEKMGDRPNNPSAYIYKDKIWKLSNNGVKECSLLRLMPSSMTPHSQTIDGITLSIVNNDRDSVDGFVNFGKKRMFLSIFNLVLCQEPSCNSNEGHLVNTRNAQHRLSVRASVYMFSFRGSLWLAIDGYDMPGIILVPTEQMKMNRNICRSGVVVRISTSRKPEPRSNAFWHKCQKI